MHQCIKNITRTHDDPEALYISASPANVFDYLRAREWLDGIQSELDKSWAVIGEVFGRQTHNGLDKLGLSVRRVRSNLDRENAKALTYLPEEIRFRVAEADMLLLLLAPLYGDDPGYGVRELTQNAYDAVQEAIYLKLPHLNSEPPSVRITVDFSDEAARFSIADNGTGMTEKILKDFFFNAGASYRASSEWKGLFLDAEGRSKVRRSGRFGVGALAAFLLGSSIRVSTRHHTAASTQGLSFSAKVEDRIVQVGYCERSIGTTIEIDVPKSGRDKLESFLPLAPRFFMFDDAVNVTITSSHGSNKTELSLKKSDSQSTGKEGNSAKIFEFSTSRYSNVQVLIDSKRNRSNYVVDSDCFVNGIAVCQYPQGDRDFLSYSPVASFDASFIAPPSVFNSWGGNILCHPVNHTVFITDRDGRAPLDLSRTRFTEEDEEIETRVAEHTFDQLVAFLKAPDHVETQDGVIRGGLFDFRLPSLVFNAKGICFADAEILNEVGASSIYRIESVPEDWSFLSAHPNSHFIFGELAWTRKNRTESVAKLTRISADTQRGFYKGAMVFIDFDLASKIEQLANRPAWLVKKIAEAAATTIGVRTLSLLEFGDITPRERARFIAVANSTGAQGLEFYSSDKWVSPTMSGQLRSESLFAKRWRQKIRGLIRTNPAKVLKCLRASPLAIP